MKISEYAILSLLMGIVSWIWVKGLLGPVVLFLGIYALREIKANSKKISGRGIAITGIVIGSIQTASLIILLIIAFTFGGQISQFGHFPSNYTFKEMPPICKYTCVAPDDADIVKALSNNNREKFCTDLGMAFLKGNYDGGTSSNGESKYCSACCAPSSVYNINVADELDKQCLDACDVVKAAKYSVRNNGENESSVTCSCFDVANKEIRSFIFR